MSYPPSIAKGGDQGPRGPICRVAEGAQVLTMGKGPSMSKILDDFGSDMIRQFQELTGHGPPKAQRFNGTKPSIPLQAIVDSINSKPNDNIGNI